MFNLILNLHVHCTLDMVDFCYFSKNPYEKFLVEQNCMKIGNRNIIFLVSDICTYRAIFDIKCVY